jgi:caffeoyl-CoA O-methyltransferase
MALTPLDNYLEQNMTSVSSWLQFIERDTHLTTLQAHMLSGAHQGRLLMTLAQMACVKNVLEIGTFTGFTAVCFAEAVGQRGRVVTIECEEEMASKAQENINRTPYKDQIEVLQGEAKNVLPQLIQSFIPDLVFIDADKESNRHYYDLLLPVLKANGIIIVDNVLWKDKVLDDSITDKKTKAIRDFNAYVAQDDRVEGCIIPLRDGMLLIRKK